MFNQSDQQVGVQVNAFDKKWYSVTVWYADEDVRVFVVRATGPEHARELVTGQVLLRRAHEISRSTIEDPVELVDGVNLVYEDR